jgi:hypothetical protein
VLGNDGESLEGPLAGIAQYLDHRAKNMLAGLLVDISRFLATVGREIPVR